MLLSPLGAGCRRAAESAAPTDDPRPALSVTRWTEKLELFLEHRALVVGQQTSFAAHLTAHGSWKPVTSGVVTLVLRYTDGTELTSRVDGPLSPGIFRPLLSPKRAGSCQLLLTVASSQVSEQIAVGPCVVHADLQSASTVEEEKSEGGRVPFLKEQQWITDFATAAVQEQTLQPTVAAYGELKPAAGKLHRVVTPISGWLAPMESPPVPAAAVGSGQILAVIVPRLAADGDRAGLSTAVDAARVELAAAEARLKRGEDLVAHGIGSQQELEEDRAAASRAKAKMESAMARFRQFQNGTLLSGNPSGFVLRTPIAGTLIAVNAHPGEFVEQGQHIFSVLNQDRLWLEARVFAADAQRVQKATDAWFTVEGSERPISVSERQGRLLTVSRAIDSQTRTLTVLFEIGNADGALRSGQLARVHLHVGPSIAVLAVPESALIEENGRYIAYVQAEGEAFERRVLTVGLRDRGQVEVRSGLHAGERLVTKGAYEIKLSSASGSVPAHGHAH